ncbi:GNAT family N-acetyltransferase [Cellulophaga sp. 20_2_10]|uniref:GNAT family N-acetyltransferase n=1 Tax=Cellulophaga sp. 20_2_10 TaxID=2942476 RepID=UPI00201ADB8F|nr:GNAT family N-acetyltransferase [Cellulophaga sp. 20_2_10]MCL5244556.1 GNAT family N-acetyltransferase [Cellulophaga sp. 20_2_10]
MFIDITNNPIPFFNLLPKDWADGLVPHWNLLRNNATVFVLKNDAEICAGGIIFSSITPEMDSCKQEALYYFSKNYLYVGYVWVPENKRKQNYGSQWFKELFRADKNKHYWLVTEDKMLRKFYKKIGFVYKKTIHFNGGQEELFYY